ncbi:hypothetical protein L1049_018091 [Liquidambar formosana]|uniref:Cytochrome P450 n=1 Tax=Liquidambar formosana TaxID=63359 RepID=A0AAP0R8X0_LIQFO
MEIMDFLIFPLSIFLVWRCIRVFTSRPIHSKSSTTKLPPGPRPLPIIGNFFELGNKPHQSLADISKTYGPLVTLKLGSTTVIIVSSPHTAGEVLHKNDHVMSNRPTLDAARALDHHEFSVVWLPAAAHWRNLRKVCTLQMLTVQRLNASQALRQKKVQELVDHVHERCSSGLAVDIGRAAFTTALNLISNTFFSIDLAHYRSNSSQDFKELVWNVMEETGRPNIADYLPALRFIDPQGIRRRNAVYLKKLFDIFDGIINQRSQLRASSVTSSGTNDVLDALLRLTKENDHEFSYNDMKHLLLDLFIAGTDTTSSPLEWAMAELLHNPTTMAKARTELQEVIGKDRPVEESDIAKLPYLQAIVKETLRLHPPAPLLSRHKAGIDVEIGGFTVPKDAQLVINVWAIGRDPNIWSNQNSFVPERFLESKIDFKGRDFELIPFGSGRRICPGLPLAYRMVHLMLASLLHSFDWKLENGMKAEDMDMSEKFGLTLQKAMPLRAIPVAVQRPLPM